MDHFDVKISTTTPVVASFTINVLSITSPAASPDTNWVQYKFRLGDFVTTGSNIYIGFREWVLDNYNDGAAFQLDLISVAASTPPVVSTWTEQTSPLATELNSVSAVDDNVAWASGATGKVVRTTNKGATWTNVSGDLPITNPGYVIWAFDASNAVVTTSPAAAAGARIFKTTNGGTNWVQTFYQADGWGDGLYFMNATTGFFYGDHTGTRLSIFKTTNAGTTWDSTGQYYPTTSDGWNNAMFGLGNQIWIGTNSTSIAYTSNAGVNWSTQTVPVANTYAIWFNSATAGMAAGASNIFQSSNSGTNWATVTSPLANNATGLCGTGTEYWFTTFSTLVYYTSNNGTTWSTQYTAPGSGSFRHITRSRTGSTIWGVRTDGGISRYGAPLVGITPISIETPSAYSVSQNYPNPFNPTTKINFALPKSGLVTLKVYDMLGKEVAMLVNEVKNVGTYTVDFNGANLSSGIYFYKVSVNGFSDVKKMMLIK